MKDGLYHFRFSSNTQGVAEASQYSRDTASMAAIPVRRVQYLSRATAPANAKTRALNPRWPSWCLFRRWGRGSIATRELFGQRIDLALSKRIAHLGQQRAAQCSRGLAPGFCLPRAVLALPSERRWGPHPDGEKGPSQRITARLGSVCPRSRALDRSLGR